MFKRAFLMILDGWGLGKVPRADAIAQADTPFFDHLMRDYPHSTLVTHGLQVGLPEGQMGNSEVGHLNLGAGRIVYQDLARIGLAIQQGSLGSNPEFLQLSEYCLSRNKACHLIGLVSDGGVHSHIDHLKALVTELAGKGLNRIYIHAITDGRDTDPHSGLAMIKDLEAFAAQHGAVISTVIGRYFAMDRDKRWERIRKAYDLYRHGTGRLAPSASAAIEKSYAEGVTDEFLEPAKIGDADTGLIADDDAVLCFNFRTDRLRQLTQVLSQTDIPEQQMTKRSLYFVTMTNYDDTFQNLRILFDKPDIKNTLGESLSRYGMTQVRIAETEKYPHVSFFFSGGREKPFTGERRILIPSPKVATYDLQPEMSAIAVKDEVLKAIREQLPDFICLNFANADMVGHTGVFQAVMRAAETVDSCLSEIIPLALEQGYATIILADHGNGDYMINEDGSPNTAHTKNPVPCILVSPDRNLKIRDGKLADIAPTILQLMGLAAPVEMDGTALLESIQSTPK